MSVLFWFVALVAVLAIITIIYLATKAKVDTVIVSQEASGHICFIVKSGKAFIFRLLRFKKTDDKEDFEVLKTTETLFPSDQLNGVWAYSAILPPNRDYFALVVLDNGEIIGRRFRLVDTKLEA